MAPLPITSADRRLHSLDMLLANGFTRRCCPSVRSSVCLCVAIMRTQKHKQFTAGVSTDDLYEIITAVWLSASGGFRIVSDTLYTFTARCYASADYAVARCLSVCWSVHPSVTHRYSVETARHIFNRFSPLVYILSYRRSC